MRLQAYNFEIVYKPGSSNLADALSRLSVQTPKEFDPSEEACIYHLARLDIPKAVTLEEVEDISSRDSELRDTITALETGELGKVPQVFKPFISELSRSGNLLIRGDRLVIPTLLRSRVLDIAHETHPGIVVMKRNLRQKVWWPLMDKEVESYVKKCKACTLVSGLSPPEPICSTKLPDRAWAHLAIDFTGPFPSGHNLLVIIDYFSRFTEVIIMKTITATLTVRAFHETFCRFGMPVSLRTDNGPQFVSGEFRQFLEQFGIEHRRTIPYWPQANGEVERINRTIGKRMKISQEQGSDWQWDLRMFVLMQNSTPHSTTGVAPSSLMFGRIMKDKLPGLMTKPENILEEIQDRDKAKKFQSTEYANNRRGTQHNSLKEGETVVVKRTQKDNKLSTTFDPEEFEVIQREGSRVKLKSNSTGTTMYRNVSHLKKLFSDTTGGATTSCNLPPHSEDSELTDLHQTRSPEKETRNESLEKETTNECRKRARRDSKRPAYLKDFTLNEITNL
ncbi:uncharacterized protein K02A2.6-like [Uranotaenia lowii]|uniref:uncharacterized protein K02A2.6-like n=1 Tax=Uranotaenia lowii TaxID=190385 RepID=UPI00247903A7|nr:uncharacterized protein K02A2.6-like [Uranotaenia lowii]